MTAETAVVLPALVAVLAVLLWGLAVGITQVRCVAAARGAAIAAARGEADAQISTHVRRSLGPSSSVTVRRLGDEVTVEVVAVLPRLRWVPSHPVRATAVAQAEPAASR